MLGQNFGWAMTWPTQPVQPTIDWPPEECETCIEYLTAMIAAEWVDVRITTFMGSWGNSPQPRDSVCHSIQKDMTLSPAKGIQVGARSMTHFKGFFLTLPALAHFSHCCTFCVTSATRQRILLDHKWHHGPHRSEPLLINTVGGRKNGNTAAITATGHCALNFSSWVYIGSQFYKS